MSANLLVLNKISKLNSFIGLKNGYGHGNMYGTQLQFNPKKRLTLYDQNGKKVDIPSTNPKNIAVFPNSERLTRRDGHEKYTKLNDLLCQLAS